MASVAVGARRQDELRVARIEIERVNEMRTRERAEAEAASLRQVEISRASISQMESKMAAERSGAALELETVSYTHLTLPTTPYV